MSVFYILEQTVHVKINYLLAQIILSFYSIGSHLHYQHNTLIAILTSRFAALAHRVLLDLWVIHIA